MKVFKVLSCSYFKILLIIVTLLCYRILKVIFPKCILCPLDNLSLSLSPTYLSKPSIFILIDFFKAVLGSQQSNSKFLFFFFFPLKQNDSHHSPKVIFLLVFLATCVSLAKLYIAHPGLFCLLGSS
jgi:hypothetical protein